MRKKRYNIKIIIVNLLKWEQSQKITKNTKIREIHKRAKNRPKNTIFHPLHENTKKRPKTPNFSYPRHLTGFIFGPKNWQKTPYKTLKNHQKTPKKGQKWPKNTKMTKNQKWPKNTPKNTIFDAPWKTPKKRPKTPNLSNRRHLTSPSYNPYKSIKTPF